MQTIKNWALGLACAFALSVNGYGCSDHDEDLFDDVDSGAALEQEITAPNTLRFGYNNPGGATGWGAGACLIGPEISLPPADCVYPSTKARRVCIAPDAVFPDFSGFGFGSDAVYDNISNTLDVVVNQLNSAHTTWGTGFTFTRSDCATANIVVRSTNFVGAGINQFVSVGCDSATAPIGAPNGSSRARHCTANGIYINPQKLQTNHGFLQTGFNTAYLDAVRRVIGHGLVVSSGTGSQASNYRLYTWYGSTLGANGFLPLEGSSPEFLGLSTRDLCLSSFFQPGSPQVLAVANSTCP